MERSSEASSTSSQGTQDGLVFVVVGFVAWRELTLQPWCAAFRLDEEEDDEEEEVKAWLPRKSIAASKANATEAEDAKRGRQVGDGMLEAGDALSKYYATIH
mmetsp:Transcript_34165/g.71932  ORF Transcript_34165/g.71932 Transcript_34165/m.71932 type:complete len:102 (+) Transcript_34165:1139-1444(+)